MPGDGPTKVVTDDDRSRGAERLDQPDDVGGEVIEIVGVDVRGLVAAVVAPQVGGDGPIATRGEPREHVTPRVRVLWKPVEEQHERTIRGARFDDVEAQAVGVDEVLLHRARSSVSSHAARVGTSSTAKRTPMRSSRSWVACES